MHRGKSIVIITYKYDTQGKILNNSINTPEAQCTKFCIFQSTCISIPFALIFVCSWNRRKTWGNTGDGPYRKEKLIGHG